MAGKSCAFDRNAWRRPIVKDNPSVSAADATNVCAHRPECWAMVVSNRGLFDNLRCNIVLCGCAIGMCHPHDFHHSDSATLPKGLCARHNRQNDAKRTALLSRKIKNTARQSANDFPTNCKPKPRTARLLFPNARKFFKN